MNFMTLGYSEESENMIVSLPERERNARKIKKILVGVWACLSRVSKGLRSMYISSSSLYIDLLMCVSLLIEIQLEVSQVRSVIELCCLIRYSCGPLSN